MKLKKKNYMYQLLEAVEYLHSNRIIHRDLKQANILWRNNTLVLIDFDYAIRIPDGESDVWSGEAGTSGYMAPEMSYPETITCTADIWSVGIIFGELLFNFNEGEFCPVEELNEQRIMRSQWVEMVKNSDYFSEAEPNAKDLLLRMIDMNPETRITSKEAKEHKYFENINDNNIEKTLIINNNEDISKIKRGKGA